MHAVLVAAIVGAEDEGVGSPLASMSTRMCTANSSRPSPHDLQQSRVGDNFDEATDQGPQNSKLQFDRIVNYIESGKREGATLHLGGKCLFQKGYRIEPTIFTNVKPNMKIVKEEIFGPVVVVARFKTEEEVLKLANGTPYGLAAGIHTKDIERASH